MEKRKIFLELLNEIVLGNNPENRIVSADEQKVLNYINGIRSGIKKESRLIPLNFYKELCLLYEKTSINLFTISTTINLFKRYKRDNNYFVYIIYLWKKLKTKKFINDEVFWINVIFELNGLNNSLIGKNDSYKKIIFRLDLFIEFAKIDFYNQNCYDYKKVLNFYLYIQSEFYVYGYNDSYIERHKKCLNILKVFLSKKLNQILIENYYLDFLRFRHRLYNEEDVYIEFLDYALDNLPLKDISFSFVFQVYSINKFLFLNNDFKSEYWLNKMRNYSFDNITESFVEDLQVNYGVSYFLINYRYIFKLTAQLYDNDNNIYKEKPSWFVYFAASKNNLKSFDNFPFKLTDEIVHKFNTVDTEWKMQAFQEKYIGYELWDDSINKLNPFEGMLWSAIVYECKNVLFANKALSFIKNYKDLDFWLNIVFKLYECKIREKHNLSMFLGKSDIDRDELLEKINIAKPINFMFKW
jgi:hypothetical protein